jgi:transcriptional regulator with XRE-family HTH domain
LPKRKNYEDGSFGAFLSDLIDDAEGLTKTDFYIKLGISKTYLFDILNNRIAPPNADMQFKMLSILNPPIEKQVLFFELAAKRREEVPADIARYLKEKKNRDKIRKIVYYKTV